MSLQWPMMIEIQKKIGIYKAACSLSPPAGLTSISAGAVLAMLPSGASRAAAGACIAARRWLAPPTSLGATMKKHRRPRPKVPNPPSPHNFSPADALESVYADLIEVDAFAHAAGEAITELK